MKYYWKCSKISKGKIAVLPRQCSKICKLDGKKCTVKKYPFPIKTDEQIITAFYNFVQLETNHYIYRALGGFIGKTKERFNYFRAGYEAANKGGRK